MKQSAGWIHVDSEPERGTAFNIYLQRVEGAVESVEPPVLLKETRADDARKRFRVLEGGLSTSTD